MCCLDKNYTIVGIKYAWYLVIFWHSFPERSREEEKKRRVTRTVLGSETNDAAHRLLGGKLTWKKHF